MNRRALHGEWDADEVAAHLLSRQPAIVRGLGRRPPWAGIDPDTQAELYLEAAAVIARMAAGGERRQWRTRRDLERAVIAAWRHQALSHWKAVNAQMRRGDRDAIAFDPDVHGPVDDPLARVLSDAHDELIARDWLAQLRGKVRDFWEPVLLHGVQFKEAGDALGVSKAERQALFRDGIEQLRRFRALAVDGLVCQLRAPAIAAYRRGDADEITSERAQAHLACCLPCALVHDRTASAHSRGLLGIGGLALLRGREMVERIAQLTGVAGGTAGGVAATKTAAVLLCGGIVATGVCTDGLGLLPAAAPPDATARVVRHATRHHEPVATTPVAAVTPIGPTTTVPAIPTAPTPTAPARTPTTTQKSSTGAAGGTSSHARQQHASVREFDPENAPAPANAQQHASTRRASTRSAGAGTPDPDASSSGSASGSGSSSAAAEDPTAAQSAEFGTDTGSGSGSSSSSSSGGSGASHSGGSSSSSTSEFGGP